MIRLANTDTSSQKLLVIAEKPSVMIDIAKALGGFTKHDDHYESETHVVAAASGHLLEQQMPRKKWGFAALPIIPELIPLTPKASQQKRLTHLVTLLSRPDIVGVINACDAGREGELIFREIIEHAECSKPLNRLWLQSMTGEGIRRAFQNIRPNASVEGLAAAGKCRTIADWLIGINITRALTALISAGGGFHKTPAGRVQTPTLAMIVERERSVLAFIPQPYWEAVATIDLGQGTAVEAKWRADGIAAAGDEGTRIGSAARAIDISTKTTGRPAAVAMKHRLETEAPPMLFKLNDLLADASNRYGFPGDMTLKIAQSLYAEKKVISYPRTEYQHLRPEDDIENVRDQLAHIAATMPDVAEAARQAINLGIDPGNKRVFDSSKVGDHTAIIPIRPDGPMPMLSDTEQKIFDLIVRRFVGAFLPRSETEVVTLTFTVEGETFQAVRKSLLVPGWQMVDGKTAEPAMATGHGLSNPEARVVSVEVEAKQTTPPGRYTDGTLLKAMEKAGKLVENEEARKSMSGRGLGTAATRTEILKKLISDGYVTRQGRQLSATPKAMALVQLIERLRLDVLASPEMTGEWEAKLQAIEDDSIAADVFLAEVRRLAVDLVETVKASPTDLVLQELPQITLPGTGEPLVERLLDYSTADGRLRISKVQYGRHLAIHELEQLLRDGVIGELDGFYSAKKRKPYSGCLRWLPAEERCEMFFDSLKSDLSADHPTIGTCPCCGGAVRERPAGYVCDGAVGEEAICQLTLKRLWCGRTITPVEAGQLLRDKRTDLLTGFRGKSGRPFKAHIVISDEGRVGFEFPAKKGRQARTNTRSKNGGN
jgi:DNA topoisomerase-3